MTTKVPFTLTGGQIDAAKHALRSIIATHPDVIAPYQTLLDKIERQNRNRGPYTIGFDIDEIWINALKQALDYVLTHVYPNTKQEFQDTRYIYLSTRKKVHKTSIWLTKLNK